ncbi:uncharacterized protein LOC110857857 [Folsomia candida]|uniref:Uncharacterized protein n=1 Tax=Folsomia candida TaxID=158441 RepID=A0A226DHZ2_FOLCA|nr:uncharacterized protein LOC110857857 [Folsomia candida]OXA44578.1 hypothetical protein Fcan01_20390 [Folsomia candida]
MVCMEVCIRKPIQPKKASPDSATTKLQYKAALLKYIMLETYLNHPGIQNGDVLNLELESLDALKVKLRRRLARRFNYNSVVLHEIDAEISNLAEIMGCGQQPGCQICKKITDCEEGDNADEQDENSSEKLEEDEKTQKKA